MFVRGNPRLESVRVALLLCCQRSTTRWQPTFLCAQQESIESCLLNSTHTSSKTLINDGIKLCWSGKFLVGGKMNFLSFPS